MSQPTKSHCQYTWTYNTEKHRERYFFCRQWCKISPANLLKWKKTELSPSSLLSINCCNWFRTTVLRKPMTKQGTVPRIFSSTPIATERDAHATRLSTFYKIPVTGHRVHLHGRPRFTGNMFPRSGRRRRHRCQHGHVLDVFTRTASPFVFSSLLYQSVDRSRDYGAEFPTMCVLWLTVINVLLASMAGVDASVRRCTCDVRNVATCSVNQGVPASRAVRNYRPHGSLARVLYDKQKADEQLEAYDKTQVRRM